MTTITEVSAAPRSEAQAAHSDALKERALGVLGHLPPFPVILNRLLASLAGEDIPFSAIGDLIEKDTVISGNILNLVNSAMYSRRGTVNSVRRALSLLGVEKVRNTVLGMSITRMWNKITPPDGWSMARFNMHSAAVATMSDCLAQRVSVSYAEGAFVAGLLHDIGRLLIALGLPTHCDMTIQLHRSMGRALGDCESAVLGFTHAELAAEALAIWNLPAPIANAVRYHDDPSGDRTRVAHDEFPLSRLVYAANQYVNSSGETITPDEAQREDGTIVLESLGLDGDQVTVLVSEFEAERKAMAQFFC